MWRQRRAESTGTTATARRHDGTPPTVATPPAAEARPSFALRPRGLGAWAAVLGTPVLLTLAGTTALGATESALPTAAVDLLYSFVRMLAAYGLSLLFAFGYGYFAATRKTGERVLVPVLDILQSVPILGFFPIAITFFVGFPGAGSVLGPNLASIFLIFTSMSWNMAFGVYESLKSLPAELKEAADTFQVRGLLRVRRVLFPATINRLVYNSVLSWTAGWYFLVAAEFIATSQGSHALPGIGSFLLYAAQAHATGALYAGLLLLIMLIAALDLFVWRPLGRRAEKYRYDSAPSGAGEALQTRTTPRPLRRAAGFVARGFRTGVTRVSVPFVGLASYTMRPIRAKERPLAKTAFNYSVLGGALVLVWLMLIAAGAAIYVVLAAPIPPDTLAKIRLLPLAAVLSFGRVVLAYLLSLAIALPLAVYLVRRPGLYKVGLPVVEVVASVPATVLFPLFVITILAYIGFEGVAILVLLTGMIWYLFFNILSGLRSIPPDLDEAAQAFGLSRWLYYRKVLLPAVLPALLTGSITAFGGGWNTLIIAEYLPFACGKIASGCRTLGVGELLNIGTTSPGGQALVVASLFTFIIVVVALNELLWKPLYRKAVEKYRYD
ncbi:MAG: ABC transporter permease subunit [Thermoplasmata archaeon]|nr:ABC transporter permease subunit [Thermoplasmata archaeon]